MALYGLSVFLETSGPQRKGRKRYIVVSFVITTLRALSGSLDMATYFQALFKSTSPTHMLELMHLTLMTNSWKVLLGFTGLGLSISIGELLLVRAAFDLLLTV
jgi:hypothetical protein